MRSFAVQEFGQVPIMATDGPRALPAHARAPHRARLASASVAGLGVAVPATFGQAELWDGFFAEHYGHAKLARAIWQRCGVERRHAVVDPRREDVRFSGTEHRMRRFQEAGLPLGVEAVEACLHDAGLDRSDVGLLTVVSCTGYGSPGIDVQLARELGLRAGLQRVHIGHMGCYAAIPGLMTTADAAVLRGRVGVLLCLELPSLHVQPPTDDVGQVVAHALFSDAAVAAAVVPDSAGFEVLEVVARTDTEHAPSMTWDVTNLGFRMGLSPEVPRVLERHVEPVVEELLGAHGLTAADIRGWAVHPGGPAILDVVEERLELRDDDLREAHAVLAEHGNCSSPTVLLVLDRIRRERDLADGDHLVVMAFGPGLTLYAALLRLRQPTPAARLERDALHVRSRGNRRVLPHPFLRPVGSTRSKDPRWTSSSFPPSSPA
jgi:predicted naringenin-chalcone synthase